MSRSNYYEILFDSSSPKYLDYVGTFLEDTARIELESSMRSAELMMRSLSELAEAGYGVPAPFEIIEVALWSELHGLVSLYNNRLLKEIGHPSEQDVLNVARMFYEVVFRLLEQPSTPQEVET
jgi:hypothetical protein